MKVTMIAAVNSTFGIGFKGGIPWHLPEDLKHFKTATVNKPVIMGRSTFTSLPGALKDRKNIVVTSVPLTSGVFIGFKDDNVVFVNSYEDALKEAEKDSPEEVCIIGGVSAYNAFWDLADKLIITAVDAHTPQDTVFDKLKDVDKDFTLESTSVHQSLHQPLLNYKILTYVKTQQDLFT